MPKVLAYIEFNSKEKLETNQQVITAVEEMVEEGAEKFGIFAEATVLDVIRIED